MKATTMSPRTTFHRLLPLAALLFAATPLLGTAQDKKPVTEPELKYQAGGSPLAGEAMYQAARARSTSSAAQAAMACCARARPASR